MTKDHIKLICTAYVKLLKEMGHNPIENPDKPLDHCAWMSQKTIELIEEGASDRKIGTWLGFVQGVFYSDGIFTIDDMRNHNRNIEDAKASGLDIDS